MEDEDEDEDIVERLTYHTATLDRDLCVEAASEITLLRMCVTDLLGHLEETAMAPRYRPNELKGSISRAQELLK